MGMSYLEKSLKNVSYGLISFFFQILVTFISQRVFIHYLGIEYQGINGLFTNILSVLSLADLGIQTAMMYTLYKPLVEGEDEQVQIYLFSFRQIFRYIALLIFLLGLMVVPFIRILIPETNIAYSRLNCYYILFLTNSALSYLAVYKSTLLQADQNTYLVKLINTITRFICAMFQIVILIMLRSFILYLLILIVSTICNNVIVTCVANKRYPFIRQKNEKRLDDKVWRLIIDTVKSTMIYKIGTTIINSTDNILISIICGTLAVGFYSNYALVITTINSIIGILTSAIIPSLGNYLCETKQKKQKERLFTSLILLFFFIATVASSCLLSCLDGIITIWIGKDFIIDRVAVLTIVGTFFFQCIAHPIWVFRESAGLFKQIKYWIVLTAVLNIWLSIIFGKMWGIAGIVLATMISRLLTIFWSEPRILYHYIFGSQVTNYWKRWLRFFLCSIISIFISVNVLTLLGNGLGMLVIKVLICVTNAVIVFTIGNKKSEEFTYWIQQINTQIKKIKRS